MKKKINLRLAVIALLAITATAVGLTLVYYNLFQRQVRADLRQYGKLLAETGIFQTAYDSPEDDLKIPGNFSSDSLRITWVDADGTVLFDNENDISEMADHSDRPEIRLAAETGEGESIRHSDTMGMDTFYYAVLLGNGTVLRVSTEAATVTNLLLTGLPVILGIAAAVLIGCVLVGQLLTRKLMKPIEDMAEHLEDGSRMPAYKELQPFADKIRSQHEHILSAVKSRQDFTANVTHELKTPITAISGYAELIENRMLDADGVTHAAAQIRQNANRLLFLITDIIRLSELDHNELPGKFETVDLKAAADECCQNCMPAAVQRNITLRCEGVSAGIYADQGLICEMIDNLLSNAIRYNREHGTVDVYVTIKNEHPVISVTDTGIGIPADQQERVFERFYRVDKSRSRATGGTGLGLAIVKHIAEIHNAEIRLQSRPGEGTEIRVMF